jgi:hypothetical protein
MKGKHLVVVVVVVWEAASSFHRWMPMTKEKRLLPPPSLDHHRPTKHSMGIAYGTLAVVVHPSWVVFVPWGGEVTWVVVLLQAVIVAAFAL